MTSEELRKALDDLCDADGEEKKARELVRDAGRALGEASARRDALAARIAPILKANRGRACKGKTWDGRLRKFHDRVIYIDEHGCVAVEPMVEAWDMTIPVEEEEVAPEGAVAESPAPSNALADALGIDGDELMMDDGDPVVAASRGPAGHPAELVAMGRD